MLRAMKKHKKHQGNASANVVDGKLILSFPDALKPVVWQMDLAEAKASALEIDHDEATGRYVLNLKEHNKKGETQVAAFENREAAVAALMITSWALENAHGRIATGGASAHVETNIIKTRRASKGRWLGIALALFVLFVVFGWWSHVNPLPVGNNPLDQAAGYVADPNTGGVPVSADDYLKGR
ncbi:MAG: hypothetical protein H7831_16950 [Magnetococcus sp. WYHC-3]